MGCGGVYVEWGEMERGRVRWSVVKRRRMGLGGVG